MQVALNGSNEFNHTVALRIVEIGQMLYHESKASSTNQESLSWDKRVVIVYSKTTV